jgi:uncharacterized protein YjiS (DUF1127 family)
LGQTQHSPAFKKEPHGKIVKETIVSTISNATARQSSAGSNILGMLAVAPRRLLAAFITWRARQAALAHLKSMSDRELKDIGLSRSQIECAVMGERARDRAFSRYY